jgi:hypothetical protein
MLEGLLYRNVAPEDIRTVCEEPTFGKSSGVPSTPSSV